jgi:transposase
MTKVKFIGQISFETQKLLKRIWKQSSHHQVRQRSHCLLLTSQGVKLKQLKVIFQVSEKTLYNWFNAWESLGLVGLYNRPGRGRKKTFNSEQIKQIKDWANLHPQQLKQVRQKIKAQWNITVSSKTIKRLLSQVRMSWHRLRRGVFGKPKPEEYKAKKSELKQLQKLDSLGIIELYYLDETGFCLTPCVPYGWQPVGEYQTIPSSRSPRLNVLGIMNRRNHLEAYVSTQTINSDVVIACINTFFAKVDKPTVIVVDQASIHTSDMIQSSLDEWKERNIEIFVLPSYSPQLNLIEILWRFMKYQWMEIDSYRDWQSLVNSVETMLREFGKQYVINFV